MIRAVRYSANGELATKTDGTGVTTYTYDVLGNLRRRRARSVPHAEDRALRELTLLAFAVLVGVGIAAGIAPALRAARLDPAVALRDE